MKPSLLEMLTAAWAEKRMALVSAIISESDFDPNKAAFEAIRNNNAALLDHLFAHGGASISYVGPHGETMVIQAVTFERHLFLPRLKELGADLDAQDKHGNTGLLLAVRRGFGSCERALRKLNARDDIPNKHGQTAAALKAAAQAEPADG